MAQIGEYVKMALQKDRFIFMMRRMRTNMLYRRTNWKISVRWME